MAWGASSKPPPPPPSTLVKILPLLILFFFLAIAAVIGYHIYCAANEITNAAGKKLEGNRIVCSRDGVKVSVTHVEDETYVDRTQSILVKAWNLSSFPAYRSRFFKTDGSKSKSRKSSVASR
ncbi:MAG: N-alpha-acetyltransferase mak3 [Watsoniomyces obsoletus]|nr:MAG: N-alpha-acetyltransferase mak3 [Watsoniomyces obsoletus]